ncbi:MAG: hypothetical protein LUF86_02435 [Clostridiales bacterium]|nr:hypothetical protein [Clostridiales bacterium]
MKTSPCVAALYARGNDLASHAAKADDYISLNILVPAKDLTDKLASYFGK